MMTLSHPQETGHLFGLEQAFELEPRWGSPIFEDDHMLELSNRKQTVTIQLSFSDSNTVLVGRISTHPTDDHDTLIVGSNSETGLTTVQQKKPQLVVVTDEERERGDFLLNAALPIIDLQLFSADVFGVSRKHAVLERDGQHIALTDLHSTNSTRLNGTLLCPWQRHIIRHGDALQLGALQLRVRFCKSQESDQSATKS